MEPKSIHCLELNRSEKTQGNRKKPNIYRLGKKAQKSSRKLMGEGERSKETYFEVEGG